jgi:hypothetical protein
MKMYRYLSNRETINFKKLLHFQYQQKVQQNWKIYDFFHFVFFYKKYLHKTSKKYE